MSRATRILTMFWFLFVGVFILTPATAVAEEDGPSLECEAGDTDGPELHPKKHHDPATASGTAKTGKVKIVFTEPIVPLEKEHVIITDASGKPIDSVKIVDVKTKDATVSVIVQEFEADTAYKVMLDSSQVRDGCGNVYAGGDGAIEVNLEVGWGLLKRLLPIGILLLVVALVLYRLPNVEIEHSKEFRRRRFLNWFPLGLTYAFLYMGRYNLTVSKNYLGDLMTKDDFGTIFGIGAVAYGCAFMINGPLCDRWGGRRTILIGAAGSAVMNLLMGLVLITGFTDNLVVVFSILYAGNMYFQSFGAVSIVKVNAGWFHVRERGVLGGVFGILISLGVYFAFDLNGMIADATSVEYIFIVPVIVLVLFFVIDFFLVRDRPADAGFENFDLGDASGDDDDDTPDPVLKVFKKMMSNRVILIIIGIEFCSGFLRNAIMQWGIIFAKEVGMMSEFVFMNWGVMLACAGILAGMFAGVISDHVFNSRRGPVAAILYGGMVVGAIVAYFVVESSLIGWTVVFMSLCIIGVHGMLSGTASMDFGGRKNAGIAVGVIDAAVYMGTGLQAVLLGKLLPAGDEALDIGNWTIWPIVMLPLAVVGLLLATRIWNAKPKSSSAGGH